MSSSTWVYPQKLTKFWQIYKAKYVFFIGVWQRMTFMSWMCFVLSLGKSPHILPSYNLQKNCCFRILSKDSLEHCREIPEDHLCNEPCWKSSGRQEIASLDCKMDPGSSSERTEPCLCRWHSSCRCPESEGKRRGKERKVKDSLQEGQELNLVKALGDCVTSGNWDKEPLVTSGNGSLAILWPAVKLVVNSRWWGRMYFPRIIAFCRIAHEHLSPGQEHKPKTLLLPPESLLLKLYLHDFQGFPFPSVCKICFTRYLGRAGQTTCLDLLWGCWNQSLLGQIFYF